MKVKSLSRSVETSTRANSGDLKKLSRSLAPDQKPLERAREYTRAVTSAKIERMFAKPFVAACEYIYRRESPHSIWSPQDDLLGLHRQW